MKKLILLSFLGIAMFSSSFLAFSQIQAKSEARDTIATCKTCGWRCHTPAPYYCPKCHEHNWSIGD